VGLPPTMVAGRLQFRELIYLKSPLSQYDSLLSTIRFALNQGTSFTSPSQDER
jgi:hypothetical protein